MTNKNQEYIASQTIIRETSYSFGIYRLTASIRQDGKVVYGIMADELDKFTPDLDIRNASKEIVIQTFASIAQTDEAAAEQLAGLQEAHNAREFFKNIITVIEGA